MGLIVDQEDLTLRYVSAAAGPGQAHGSGFSDAAIYRRSSGADWWPPIMKHLAELPYALAADPYALEHSIRVRRRKDSS